MAEEGDGWEAKFRAACAEKDDLEAKYACVLIVVLLGVVET